MRLMPTAEVGFLGMVRNEETLEASTYAERLPADLSGRQCYVLDPMLATGGTLAAAIRFLTDRGADHITCICLLVAPEGVREPRGGPGRPRRPGHRGDRGARRAAQREGLHRARARRRGRPALRPGPVAAAAAPGRALSRSAHGADGDQVLRRGRLTDDGGARAAARTRRAIRPPCRATIAWTMVRPRPVPWIACSVADRRPEEPGEQLRLLVLGDADPGVADHDLGVLRSRTAARARSRRRPG